MDSSGRLDRLDGLSRELGSYFNAARDLASSVYVLIQPNIKQGFCDVFYAYLKQHAVKEGDISRIFEVLGIIGEDPEIQARCECSKNEYARAKADPKDTRDSLFRWVREIDGDSADIEIEAVKRAFDKDLTEDVVNPEAAKYFDPKKGFMHFWVAKELMEDCTLISMWDNGDIYVWRDGCYRPNGEAYIAAEAQKRLGEEANLHRINEIIEDIRRSTYTDRKEEPPNLIPLKNGIFDLDTGQLLPHSPQYMFFNVLPVEYNPEAICPAIDRFLGEIVGREEDTQLLREIAGYCLYRSYAIQKGVMAVGDGANGKSTYLSVIKALLGVDNVSARSLQDIENDRFAAADLFGKLANIYADLPPSGLKHTGKFKMLTGGDILSAEHKFRQPFKFDNYAKLIFSANQIPEVEDESDAYYRRWVIPVFPNKFEGDNADKNLLQKLTTPQELSGFLNEAIDALKRVLQRGNFCTSLTTDETREDYKRKASPVYAFVADFLTRDQNAMIPKKELYTVYCAYCRAFDLPIKAGNVFFRDLLLQIPFEEARAPVVNGKPILEGRPRVLSGIRYKKGIMAGKPPTQEEKDQIDQEEKIDKTEYPLCVVKNLENGVSVQVQNNFVQVLYACVQDVQDNTFFFHYYEGNYAKKGIEYKKGESGKEEQEKLGQPGQTPEEPGQNPIEPGQNPIEPGQNPIEPDLIIQVLKICEDCGANTEHGATPPDVVTKAAEEGIERSRAIEILHDLEVSGRIKQCSLGRFRISGGAP